MEDRDNCITAINIYIENQDKIMDKFNSEYESVKASNKRITDLNEQNEKNHATNRANYQKVIDAVTKDDIGNNINCGSLPDPSRWVDVSRYRDNIVSKWVCKYRYSPTEINRLMNVWDDENKFIKHSIQDLPTPPSGDTLNLNCCSNKINVSNSDQARIELKNIDQTCNQSITNNNRDGGDSDSGGGDSGDDDSTNNKNTESETTNNKNTESETSTSDQDAKRRKIIIALSIFLFIFVSLVIIVGVYLVYK